MVHVKKSKQMSNLPVDPVGFCKARETPKTESIIGRHDTMVPLMSAATVQERSEKNDLVATKW